MRDVRLALAVAFLTAIWTVSAIADPNPTDANSRPPLGNNPNPIIWGGQPSKPTPPARPAPPAQPPAKPADSGDHDRWQHGAIRPYFGGLFPYFSGAFVVGPYYSGYQSYLYAYPPLYVPFEGAYGTPVRPFVGAGNNAGASPRDNDDEAPEPKKGANRGTNAQSIALAWRLIGFGDARFAEREYGDANERYRSASRTAPQLADAWFRQAFALIAMGRYDQAVTAISRGLKINPKWPSSDFELKDIYGPDKADKDAHRDALAEAAESKPNDADLLFLIGVHLYFDGQADRAAKFFWCAKEISGDPPDYLKAFLPKP